MTIQEYRRVFRERWLSILLVVLIGAAMGAGVYYLRPATYTASLQMYISTRAVSQNESVFAGEGVADRRVKSYVELATSDRVASAVVKQLGLRISPAEVASKITAASSNDSVVVNLFAVDTSPQEASAIVNATAQALSDLVNELEASTTPDNVSPVVVRVIQPAAVPTAPTGRGLPQWVVLGLLIGVAGGVVLALVRNAMDNTIKTLAQLRSVSGVPNLGTVAFDAQIRRRPLVVHDEPHSARAEAFRQLRTNVQFVDIENQHKILTVASPMSGEGKTTTLVNLAIALGAAGGSVLIVEADLRRPKAADILGMDRSVGLTSVIAGRVPVHQAIRSWQSGPIDLLASGPLPPNPSELLANRRMRAVLNEVRSRYDVILVDTPPLIPVTDAAAIAPATDGAILLCQFHQTTRQQVEAAVEALRAVGAPIVGSVFTKVPGLGSNEALASYKSIAGTRVELPPAPPPPPPRPPAPRVARHPDTRTPSRPARSAVGLVDPPTQRLLRRPTPRVDQTGDGAAVPPPHGYGANGHEVTANGSTVNGASSHGTTLDAVGVDGAEGYGRDDHGLGRYAAERDVSGAAAAERDVVDDPAAEHVPGAAADHDRAGGDPDDDTPGFDTPGFDTASRDTASRDTEDGDTAGRDTADGDTPSVDTPNGHTADGHTADGDRSDGHDPDTR